LIVHAAMDFRRKTASQLITSSTASVRFCILLLVGACALQIDAAAAGSSSRLPTTDWSTLCAAVCASPTTSTATMTDCVAKCELLLATDRGHLANAGRTSAATSGELRRLPNIEDSPTAGDEEEEEDVTADDADWSDGIFESGDEVKRAPSSFVRIGRQQHPRTYFGKRSSSSQDVPFAVKSPRRPSSLLDKRYSSFVRIGRRAVDASAADSQRKRHSSFVRIGRAQRMPPLDSAALADPRNMFVLPGSVSRSAWTSVDRRLPSRDSFGERAEDDIHAAEKRYSSFVRIGRDQVGTK
jgi:hypothetical protein